MTRSVPALTLVATLATAGMAAAQPLGTFRWQLQPFCNVVTLAVTQTGSTFRVEGTDDQCGAASGAASAIGTAFLNPDGHVGFGINIVAAPGGGPVHVEATMSTTSFSGTWRDSAGRTGAFVFTPGAGSGGSPRPPASALTGVAVGSGLILGGSPGQEFLTLNGSVVRDIIGVRSPTFGSLGLGSGALANTVIPGYDNTAIGDGALRNTTTGDNNTAVGNAVMESNTSGAGNTAMGSFAMRLNNGGSDNTAFGSSALTRNAGSHGNTALGRGALAGVVFGNYNVGIGVNAGLFLQAGSYNTYINNSGANLDNYTTRISVTNAAYRTFIGGIRGITTAIANAVPVMIDSAGQLGTVSSSRRYKQDIEGLGAPAEAVLRLRPVQFRYAQAFADGGRPLQYGLVAEEVAEVLPELVAYDDDGRPETVMYQALPTLLLAQVRRLEHERAGLTERVRALDVEHQRLLDAQDRLRAELAAAQATFEARLALLEKR